MPMLYAGKALYYIPFVNYLYGLAPFLIIAGAFRDQ